MSKKLCLVVDDSLTIRTYHSSILRSLGFETETAENGLDALEKCMEKKYDIIFSDINMPVMDGYEFVKKLRKMEGYKYTPVIFVTTLDSEEDRKKGFLAGATLYVVKPINMEILRKILESIQT